MAKRRQTILQDVIDRVEDKTRSTAWRNTAQCLINLSDIPDTALTQRVCSRTISLYSIAPFSTYKEFVSKYNQKLKMCNDVKHRFERKVTQKRRERNNLKIEFTDGSKSEPKRIYQQIECVDTEFMPKYHTETTLEKVDNLILGLLENMPNIKIIDCKDADTFNKYINLYSILQKF